METIFVKRISASKNYMEILLQSVSPLTLADDTNKIRELICGSFSSICLVNIRLINNLFIIFFQRRNVPLYSKTVPRSKCAKSEPFV